MSGIWRWYISALWLCTSIWILPWDGSMRKIQSVSSDEALTYLIKLLLCHQVIGSRRGNHLNKFLWFGELSALGFSFRRSRNGSHHKGLSQTILSGIFVKDGFQSLNLWSPNYMIITLLGAANNKVKYEWKMWQKQYMHGCK